MPDHVARTHRRARDHVLGQRGERGHPDRQSQIRRGQNGAIDFKYNDAINGRNGANFVVQPGDVIVVN